MIGAGIAGPVAAMFLRRIGVEAVVAERRDAVAQAEGAFLGLAPNGMHVLEALGLAEVVAREGHACDAFWFLDGKGKRLGTIDRSRDRERFGWPLTMVRRGRLHALLAEAAVERGVELRFGARLVALDRGQGIDAHFEHGPSLHGDLLLGCDGLRSTVRALVLPDAPQPRPAGLLDYGGFAPTGTPFPPGVNVMVFGHRAFFGSFTTPTGETWWFHNGAPTGDDRPSDARQRLTDLHRDDPAWIRELVAATPEIFGPWPMYEIDGMPRWHEGRVCLLGDAAHAMSPSAGQGAALAMEDAMVLARCLRDDADPAGAFAAFERERRPRVDAIARQARRNSNRKLEIGPVAAWIRNRMIGVFLPLMAAAQTKSYAHRIAWEPDRAA